MTLEYSCDMNCYTSGDEIHIENGEPQCGYKMQQERTVDHLNILKNINGSRRYCYCQGSFHLDVI